MFRPGMRAYIIPLVAGPLLVLSAFLPWVRIGELELTGMPDTNAIWVVALGAIATLLAFLSLMTRRNSRHPLLVVGLLALGLMFLSWRLMPRAVAERAALRAQAVAIVEKTPAGPAPAISVGIGIYLGLAAACAIVGFGLTIVVKRVSQPWAPVDPDDDIP
jgi:hypothetical protein